ncbi:YoaK family protein [Clostridium sp.]|uniref:YoaK family protein n=1 Tax=Clostridium sp. TaxID=1506 RepID=UPI00260B9413|nr:YoaK family protein [Clostridium sp.]
MERKIINRIRIKIPSHKITSESLRLGILLEFVGGFLDAYTYICRGGVFANAESGNIVLFSIGLASKNYKIATTAIIQILFYALGTLVTEMIKDKHGKDDLSKQCKIILIVESFILIMIGFMPTTVPNRVVTASIAFIASIQTSSFRKLVDSPYATTMCTANLRTAMESLYSIVKNKDKKLINKFSRYMTIIIFFAIGGALGGIISIKFGVKSIWVASLILIIAYLMFYFDEYRYKKISQRDIIL